MSPFGGPGFLFRIGRRGRDVVFPPFLGSAVVVDPALGEGAGSPGAAGEFPAAEPAGLPPLVATSSRFFPPVVGVGLGLSGSAGMGSGSP